MDDTKADAPVSYQAQAGGPNPDYVNNSGADRGVTVFRWAARAAFAVAEKAANAVTQQLRETEQERDQLARRVGGLQSRIDALCSERDYHTRLVRELGAALEV